MATNIPKLPVFTGKTPVIGQVQPEFNINRADKLAYDAQLFGEEGAEGALNTTIEAINTASAEVESNAASAEASATSAEQAAAALGYKGEWTSSTVVEIGGIYGYQGSEWRSLTGANVEPVEGNDWRNTSLTGAVKDHTWYVWGESSNGDNIAVPYELYAFGDGANRVVVYTTQSGVVMGAEPDGNFIENNAPYLALSDAIEDTKKLDFIFSNFKDIELSGDFIYDNSTGSLSITDDMRLYGEYKITGTSVSNPVITGISKSGFSFSRGKIRGSTELISAGTGSKLVLLEDCNDFSITETDASKSNWDNIYLRRCSDFIINRTKTNYGKSSGITLEDCSSYIINLPESNNNGRNSSDNSYADLISGMESHKGRGITVFATDVMAVDQKGSVINLPKCKKNTEFNIRAFAQTSSGNPGLKNLDIIHPIVEDGGAPAGTYGAVTTVDKGVDILVNSSTISETENVNIYNPQIVRNFTFGNTISLAGGATINGGLSQSASENSLSAILLFSGNPIVIGHKTKNFGYYYSVGSGGATTKISDAEGEGLISVTQSVQNDTTLHGRFFARSSGAGNGLGLNDRLGLDIDVELYDFENQVTINQNTAGTLTAKTYRSLSQGIAGANSIYDPSKLQFRGCAFDLANPNFLGSIESIGDASYLTQKVYGNAAPSPGQGVWPDSFVIERRNPVTSSGGALFQYGWIYRQSSDTWDAIQINIS